MKNHMHTRHYFKLSLYGFVAGFLATLTVHQFALWLLRQAGIAPFAPYNMTPTQPFGLPAVISLAFWGGIWGILLALFQRRLAGGSRYWFTIFGFGAVYPSLVALLIVAPLKGHPIGVGWHWQLLVTAFIINGVWGLGTGGLVRWMFKRPETHETQQLSGPECSPGLAC